MSSRPYKVAVQGAKPRKGEHTYRRFATFESATTFAAQQARSQWRQNGCWFVQNVESGQYWTVSESGIALLSTR